MAFSSRRRNYLLTPHRKDGLVEWMKEMLNHSFVLDALDTTAADTFSHFEMLIEEHRSNDDTLGPSRLQVLVPTVGTFHTSLPLRKAFVAYNKKYALTKRKFITISFNELRHILNLAQIMALRGVGDEEEDKKDFQKYLKTWTSSPGGYSHADKLLPPAILPPILSLEDSVMQESGEDVDVVKLIVKSHDLGQSENILSDKSSKSHSSSGASTTQFKGPRMITFDGDQTLYSDGSNFEGNPQLASYLYLLLRHGVTLAVVTAAGYEYNTEKYEMRLSGLLSYFKSKNLPAEDCERFYLFGGECNFLLKMGSDYKLHPIEEHGTSGWMTATKFIHDTPGNWEESDIQCLLDVAESTVNQAMKELRLRGTVMRKKRAVGLYPKANQIIPREALDETVLRVHDKLREHDGVVLPFCAFNGGSDVWVDVGNKRVGVHMLTAYLHIPPEEVIHVGDQFLNTGNDYAARGVCPCIWITNPEETTYILKSILRLAGVSLDTFPDDDIAVDDDNYSSDGDEESTSKNRDDSKAMNLSTFCQRAGATKPNGNKISVQKNGKGSL